MTWKLPVNLCYMKTDGSTDQVNSLMADPEFLLYIDIGCKDTKWIKVSERGFIDQIVAELR